MIKGIIFTILTIIFFPLVFFILSRTVYSNLKLRKYPTQLNDGIGDIVFLSVFNGIFAELYNGFNLIVFLICIIGSFFLTSLYVNYQKNTANYFDWSKPKQGILNFGGWYHAFYMLIQILIIFYALIMFCNNIFLWLLFIGYFILSLVQILVYGYT